MTGIVDYNAGNICSVERALDFLKAPFVLSKKPDDLARCDRLIFPGVGDAEYAMEQLRRTGFDVFLKEWASAGKPLAGVCLGSQIIFEHSDEGNTDCLGLLPGTVRHFAPVWKENGLNADGSLKIPHMGWSSLRFAHGGSVLLDGVPEQSDFYFVHSYVIQVPDATVVKAYAEYGIDVPAVVEKDNISVFQFHPEKSGRYGLQILRNYVGGDISSGGADGAEDSAQEEAHA